MTAPLSVQHIGDPAHPICKRCTRGNRVVHVERFQLWRIGPETFHVRMWCHGAQGDTYIGEAGGVRWTEEQLGTIRAQF